MQEKLAIAGSGAIACGLAATAARHGEVVLWARSDASRQRARASVDKLCGRLSGEVNAKNIHIVGDLEELRHATFVVEAIVEDLEAKADLLALLSDEVSHDAVLGTTTSSLSVSELAEASGRPNRFVGLHVFNPVPRMKLVELAFPDNVDDDVRTRARALCDQLDKTVVEVPDLPGFVVNRLLFPFLFSAVRFQDETGMESEAIDQAMVLGAGHPMGPLALLDFVGLDVSAAIGDEIGVDVPQRVRTLISEGALGKKSGRGFYTYS